MVETYFLEVDIDEAEDAMFCQYFEETLADQGETDREADRAQNHKSLEKKYGVDEGFLT